MTSRPFIRALFFVSLTAAYAYGTVAPTIIACNRNRMTSYIADNNNQLPAWFENWKTPAPGNFVFEFTTSQKKDIVLAFHDEKITNNTTAPLLGITIGGNNNTKILIARNQAQGSIGLAANAQQFDGVTIPPANYVSTQGFALPATTIKVQFDALKKILRLWSKKPTVPSFPSTPFFSTDFKNMSDSFPSTLQYFSFANGDTNGQPNVQYGNISRSCVPQVLRCIDPLKFTYRKDNSSTGAAEPSWFETWQTLTPGRFIVDFMTDYENNFTMGFSPTILKTTDPVPFCLSLATDDGTGVRVAKSMPQAPEGYNVGTLLKSPIYFPNNACYRKADGFEVEVVSLRIELDQTQENPVLRIWCKPSNSLTNQYALLLDSTDQAFPAEDREKLREVLGTEPLKYFSFTRGVKNGKPTNRDETDRVRIKNYGGYPEVGNIKIYS